jgi:putative ABC transport system permease protein
MVMVKKAFAKDLRRSIIKSHARFLSILAIIALGVGFFAGINATEPDMILSADKYFKDTRLADFRLISPLGFKPEDIEAVRQTAGVSAIQEGYSKDVFLISEAGATAVVRLFSHDPADLAGSGGGISVPQIIEGRLPENPGEIAIESGGMVPEDIRLGSIITADLSDEAKLGDSLATDTFTVVGRITSPMYLSFERGQTNIGDGSISFFAYIAEDDFTMEKITELFVRTADSDRLTAYSDAYKTHLEPIQSQFELIGETATGAETKLLRDELNESKAELLLNKQEAETKLADGEKKLADAEQEINDGEQKLADNEAKYTQQLADKRLLLEKGRAELNAGTIKYFNGYTLWLEGYIYYLDGRDQLNVTKQQLDDASVQIGQGKKDLAEAKIQLDAAKVMLDTTKNTLDDLKQIRQSLPSDDTVLTPSEYDALIAEIRKNVTGAG